MQEGGVGLREGELDRQRVDDLDARELGRLAALEVLEALDRREEARAGRLGLGLHHPLDRVFHVLGDQLAAVVEFDARRGA